MISSTHYKALFKLGIPIVIGQLGMIVLGFADTLMIGHHSTEDLAGASFVNNIFNLAIIFATGFSYGLTPIVGSLFGQGEQKAVGRTLKNALLVNGLIGILLTSVMGALYLNIHRLGQPEELLPLMRPYYMVLLISAGHSICGTTQNPTRLTGVARVCPSMISIPSPRHTGEP